MIIKFEDGKMRVKTDYNARFIKKARELQGKWNDPYWDFPAENEDYVRDALLMFYAEDGRYHDTVTLDVNLDDYSFSDTINLGTVVVAKRTGRDYPVKLHKNAMVISGNFHSRGGSVKNPCITCEEGTVLRINNFPSEIYETIKDMNGIALVSDANKSKDSLLEEKERLLTRLSEIETLLRTF